MSPLALSCLIISVIAVVAIFVAFLVFLITREVSVSPPPALVPLPAAPSAAAPGELRADVSSAAHRPRVVFTMTTIPSRLERIAACVRNLLQQSIEPDAVVVNLPDVSRRQGWRYRVPDELRRLALSDQRVVINRCKDDVGPLTKIYPTLALETNPQTRIFPVDDDCVFPRDYFSELLAASLKEPNIVFGYHGLNIKSRSAGDWAMVNQHEGAVDVVETVTGAVYRRGMLTGLRPPPGDCPCMLADDLWINDHVARRGFQRKLLMSDPDRVTSRGRKDMPMYNDLDASDPLYMVNVMPGAAGASGGNGNSRCIRYLHMTRDQQIAPPKTQTVSN